MPAATSTIISISVAIGGLTIAAGSKAYSWWQYEAAFEDLLYFLKQAEKRHPNVVRAGPWFSIYNLNDWAKAEVVNGKPIGSPADGYRHLRVVRMKPRDGFLSNDWLVKKFDKTKHVVERKTELSTEEAKSLFDEAYMNIAAKRKARKSKNQIRVV